MSEQLKKQSFNALSKREKQVLDYMLKGALVKDICKELELKSNTISTFKKNIFKKTGTNNVIELFRLANQELAK
jgi:DNA-binding NarL/FixJ family response regulator